MDADDPDLSTNATGASTSSSWDDDSYSIGGAVGYNWIEYSVPLRTELEYMYHGDIKYKYSNDSNSTSFKNEVNIQTVYFNVYYDFYNKTQFIPYINAGAGVAIIGEDYSADGLTLDKGEETTTNFSWNLGAGVAWEINEHWLLDLAYRYEYYGSGGDSVTGTSSTLTETFGKADDFSSHNAILGIRYQF